MRDSAIWKFPLEMKVTQSIAMPFGAKVLSVQMQMGVMCVWAVVDPNAETILRTFRIFGTGHPFPDWITSRYVGTVQQGEFVWHVFEKEGVPG